MRITRIAAMLCPCLRASRSENRSNETRTDGIAKRMFDRLRRLFNPNAVRMVPVHLGENHTTTSVQHQTHNLTEDAQETSLPNAVNQDVVRDTTSSRIDSPSLLVILPNGLVNHHEEDTQIWMARDVKKFSFDEHEEDTQIWIAHNVKKFYLKEPLKEQG